MISRLLLVVACALIDPDGRVLLAQRAPGKAMGGLWEFPGGKVDSGEVPEETLIRELREELGITVREACLAPVGGHAAGDGAFRAEMGAAKGYESIRHAARRLAAHTNAAGSSLTRFAYDMRGATAIEYALIASIITVTILTSMEAIGTTLNSFFESLKF